MVSLKALPPFLVMTTAIILSNNTPLQAQPSNLPPPGGETPTAFDVHEGTSMAVSVSPDGKWLAVDLQGSLWIISAKGGRATRITDYFNDARQPVWAPDAHAWHILAFVTAVTTCGPSGPMARMPANSHRAPMMIASRLGQLMVRRSPSHPIAQAVTTSGRSMSKLAH
ncbi:TolB family protein [Sphingobium sp. Ant17]|uniref:TolB family protein n=1 Tax=Sphingobium sp. Ant17 TaxID=1461752 RepID=UPI001F342899|nr:hypothetical protein [Sphingobium sp. Ant17]